VTADVFVSAEAASGTADVPAEARCPTEATLALVPAEAVDSIAGANRCGDEGAATIVAAVAIAVLLSLAALGVHLGAAMLIRHRAANVADLSALAAAAAVAAGPDEACQRAHRVADRSGARLAACQVRGQEVFVEVTVRPPDWLSAAGTASAHARAGPAEESGAG